MKSLFASLLTGFVSHRGVFAELKDLSSETGVTMKWIQVRALMYSSHGVHPHSCSECQLRHIKQDKNHFCSLVTRSELDLVIIEE